MMFGTFLIVLAIIKDIQAMEDIFVPNKCVNVDAYVKDANRGWIDELLKNAQKWNVQYSYHTNQDFLRSMSITIIPSENDVTIIQLDCVRSTDELCEPHHEYIVEIQDKMFLTSSKQGEPAEFKYYIMKNEPGRYMYIYRCSTKKDAITYDGDERYVIVKEGRPLTIGFKNEEEKEEIKSYDRSLLQGFLGLTGVFRERLTKLISSRY